MIERNRRSVRPAGGRYRVALFLALALAASACGSRLDRQALEAANGAVQNSSSAATAGPIAASGSGGTEVGDSGTPSDLLGSAGDAGGTAGADSGGTAPKGVAATGGGAPSAGTASGGGGPSEEIVLGWVGTTSGVLGALLADQAPGVRAWVADANASGRLGNRKVRVIFKDDGGDPGKSAAFVREFVEKDNVVAMFAPQTVLTGQAWVGYLGEKGVPLLGSDGGNPVTDHSSISFQPMAGADIGSPASMVTTFMAVQPGKTKIALLYCRELNTCHNSGRVVNDYSKKVGINVVYTGENSLAAPDYTADVLAAKNAGAEAVLTYYDHQSTIRIKQAMDRQGWNVPIIGPKSLAISEFLRLGGGSIDGIYTSATSQPFCCSPATGDYMQAMQRYAPDSPYGDFGAGAWLTGKMLEKAASAIPGPLTRQSLMEALYNFKGETLGGRVPPLTFPKGSADRQNVNVCTVPLQVKGGKFITPVGLAFRCATVPPTTVEPAK